VPARYVGFMCLNSSRTKTNIVKADNYLSQLGASACMLAQSAIFTVRTPQCSRYSSMVFTQNGRKGFRYDPCCMTSANESAKELCRIFEENTKVIEYDSIEWTGTNAVIVDNWTSLHWRSRLENQMEERTVARIYIGDVK
jgi:hypothetical protein